MNTVSPRCCRHLTPLFALLPILAGFLLAGNRAAALLPEAQWSNDPAYVESEVMFRHAGFAQIDVTMDADLLKTMLDRTDSNAANADEYFPCSVVYQSSLVPAETIADCAIRLKGNTSRGSSYCSFKLKFNEFVPGREIHGIRRLNLNGEHNDSAHTFQRSRLGWELMRRMDTAAPRTAFARLTINGQTTAKRNDGSTVNLDKRVAVEEVDEIFLNSRFEKNDGNLFKCLYPAPLLVRPAGDYDYIESWGRPPYELQTNEALHDYTGLAHFIEVLNNTSDAQIEQALANELNVDGFLRALAVEVAIGQWDGYWSNMNNYFLYQNPQTRQMEFMSYDLDNTFGIDFFSTNWAKASIYDFKRINGDSMSKRPLVKRILDNAAMKNRYSRILKYMVENHLRNDILDPLIDAWAEEVRGGTSSAEDDIKSFISTRRSSILSQLSSSVPAETLTPYPTPTPLPTPTPDFGASPLRINEYMASNKTTINDDMGEFDDWIELINGGTEPLNAGGYYVTDNVTEPTRYRLPDGLIIPAGGFIIVWADGDPEQDNPAAGHFHTSFKLDAAGEEVAIFMPDGTTLLDHRVFGAQTTDVSEGRYPDATGEFVSMTDPSPGQPNRLAGSSPTRTATPSPSASPSPSPSLSPSPSASVSPSPSPSVSPTPSISPSPQPSPSPSVAPSPSPSPEVSPTPNPTPTSSFPRSSSWILI